MNDFARSLREEMDLDPLLERIGNARYVLLGEASHGTAEYYTWRTKISQRLIAEQGFTFIAVEGDWPDCYRVNRYVRGFADAGTSAREVLHNFQRWPTWMWANEEIVELVEWLRQHNEGLPEERRVGFYGLDVYSLWDSLNQVLGYLRRDHPDMLEAARKAFECFEPYGEDVHEYAQTTHWIERSCEVYHPDYERGNYVPTVLPRRYDAFLYLDETHALHPLHEVLPHEEHEVPETFPFGV